MRRIDRREFAREASLAFLSGITVTVSACGGGGGYSSPTTNSSPPPSGNAADEVGQISANHGHTAVVQAAWLQAGGSVDLDIRGSATHSHMVSLVADALRDMRDGRKVQKESTTNEGHTHTVTFNTENPEPPVHY
jgi:hypothetical protein